MTKLFKLLKQNFLLKLISVCLAFVLWLVVVNVSNPEITDNVTMDIQVNYGNELLNAGKAFTLDSKTVRISYKVRTSYRSHVRPSSFRAYVDMRDYSITGAVPVYVEVADEVSGIISGVTQTPMVIHVSTEDMQEKAFKPIANVVGETAPGYMAGNVQLDPEEVVLYGPVSEIGQISNVGINVDISGAEETIVGMGRTLFYNANGNVISVDERVSVRNDITYTVPIYKTKSLSINVPTSGQPAPGFTLSGIETDPSFVSVYGEDEILERYNTIYLPQGLMDITGASDNVTITADLKDYLPEGLTMVQPVSVTAMAKITRQMVNEPREPFLQPSQPAAETTAAENAETAAAPGTEQVPGTEPTSETEAESGTVHGHETGTGTGTGHESQLPEETSAETGTEALSETEPTAAESSAEHQTSAQHETTEHFEDESLPEEMSSSSETASAETNETETAAGPTETGSVIIHSQPGAVHPGETQVQEGPTLPQADSSAADGGGIVSDVPHGAEENTAGVTGE